MYTSTLLRPDLSTPDLNPYRISKYTEMLLEEGKVARIAAAQT